MKEALQDGLSDERMNFLKVAAQVDARYRQFPTKITADGRTFKPNHPGELFTYISYQRNSNGKVIIGDLHVDFRTDNFSGERFVDERPQWLRRIAESMLVIQEQGIDKVKPSILDQMVDPLTMMGSSLVFNDEKDAIVWGKFRDSLIGITWPQTTSLSTKELAESQAKLFAQEVFVWLELGITSETISKWFNCLESILSVPGLHTKYLSQQGFFGEPMLADKVPLLKRKKNISKLYDHSQPYKRIDTFSMTVGSFVDDSLISDSALRVATLTNALIENDFPQPVIEVPASYERFVILVTNAIERSLTRNEKDYDKIAKNIIRFLRRNHVQFGYEEVMRICASFLDHGDGDVAYAEGLELLDRLQSGAREKCTPDIQDYIIPKLIQQIRMQKLLKNGNPKDAEKFDKFLLTIKGDIDTSPQNEHYDFGQFLRSKNRSKATTKDKIDYIQQRQADGISMSAIGVNDTVIKVSMTGRPPTYAHLELLYDLLEVTGVKTWVIIEPNNNPGKTRTHGSLADRWIAAHDSFAHIPGIIMMPLVINDNSVTMSNSGATFARLREDQRKLDMFGYERTIYRGCGIEKLDPKSGWKYGSAERSADIGNKWPHIFVADKLIGPYWTQAPEIIQRVLCQFPDTKVLVSPVVNHGTNIRNALALNQQLSSIYLAH